MSATKNIHGEKIEGAINGVLLVSTGSSINYLSENGTYKQINYTDLSSTAHTHYTIENDLTVNGILTVENAVSGGTSTLNMRTDGIIDFYTLTGNIKIDSNEPSISLTGTTSSFIKISDTYINITGSTNNISINNGLIEAGLIKIDSPNNQINLNDQIVLNTDGTMQVNSSLTNSTGDLYKASLYSSLDGEVYYHDNSADHLMTSGNFKYDSSLYILTVIGTVSAATLYGNLNWSYITSTPTTLAGYGITDALGPEVLSAYTLLTTFNLHTGATNPHGTSLFELVDVNTGGTQQGYYLSYSAGTWVGVPDATDLSNYYTKQEVYNTGQTYTRTEIDNLLTASTVGYYTSAQTDQLLTGYTTLISFNSHTGSTGSTNPHRTSFFDLTSTAHTHSNITNVDYINFNTASTVVASAGTLYYDQGDNALSYKPYTVNNDVTLNVAQETVIRIFNNTGSIIYNGTVCHMNGAYIDLNPTVELALSNNDKLTTGVATHDIPINSYGFITVRGIVRDINITSAATVGEACYLSDTVPGGLVFDINDLQISSRISRVGRVLSTGATGRVYVNIDNENTEVDLTVRQQNVFVGNNVSTGVFSFDGLSVSSTTFNVGAVKGWIIDNTTNPLYPVATYIDFPLTTGLTTPYLNTGTESSVLITSAGTILTLDVFPTSKQRRQNIYLGKLGHTNKSTFTGLNNSPDFILSPLAQLRDMFTPIKFINDGVIPSPNGTNLNFNTSAGVLYGLGIGYVTDRLTPDSVNINATSPCTFQYRVQTGGTFSNTTTISPSYYDLNGNVTLIGGSNKQATNQRIYLLTDGRIRIQYGQQIYPSLAEAIVGAQTEIFNVFINLKSTGTLIGVLSVRNEATNLSDIAWARFLTVSKFGESVGGTGGISTTTLQQAYDNSVNPEIVTNSILDGVQIRGGTGDNTAKNLIIENNGTVETAWIKANGEAWFTSVSAGTFYGNLDYSYITNVPSIWSGYTLLTDFNAHTGDTSNPHNVTLAQISGVSLSDYNTFTGTTLPSNYVGLSTYNTYTGVTAPSSFLSANTYIPTSASIISEVGTLTLEPTGFPSRTTSTISFDRTGRTFTITPTGTSYDIYIYGTKYTKTGETATIPNATNNYFIYYDDSAQFVTGTTVWDIPTTVPIALVYWNAALQDYVMFEERHGIVMDSYTHREFHENNGTYVVSGYAASTYTLFADATATLPVVNDNRYTIATGVIADEDIRYTTTTLNSALTYTVWYRSGTGSTNWVFTSGLTNPYLVGTTYLYYNRNVGGTWSLTELASQNYVVYWHLVTTSTDGNKQHIIIPDQAVYTTQATAAAASIQNMDFGSLPFAEIANLYKIVWRTRNTYTTPLGRCRIQLFSRIVGNTVTITATGVNVHANLAGLPADDHQQYALLAGRNGDTLNIDTINDFSASGITVEGVRMFNTDLTASTVSASTLYGNLDWTYITNTAHTHDYVSNSTYNTYTGTTVPSTYATIVNLNSHTGNTDNPHNVTLAQISGVSLSDFNTYTGTTAPSNYVGLSTYNTYTGTTVPSTYATIVNLNAHTGNTDNPHNTTIIQLSGVSLTDFNTYTGTTAPSTYATIVNLNSHTGDTNNPHNVTITQISGVSLSDFNTFTGTTLPSNYVSLSTYNTYTGTTVPSTYATIVNLNSHTGNTSNPHNVTLAQISGVSLTTYNTYTGVTAPSLYLSLSGGTITGDVNVTGNVTALTYYGDGSKLTGIATGSSASNLNQVLTEGNSTGNKDIVITDGQKLNGSGAVTSAATISFSGTTTPLVYINNLEITENGNGVILRSPNGTRFKLYVDNDGNLTTTPA